MITYKDALRIILENTPVPEPVDRPVGRCAGQVSAEDVHARVNFPPADISTRDGYAVRWEDVKGASLRNPVRLPIIETVRAGYVPRKAVAPGSCSRIMTGAHIPQGADCVVRFEDTDEPGGKNGPNAGNPHTVSIRVPGEPGTFIQRAGASFTKGAPALPQGTVIGPPQVSAMITAGWHRVKVIPRPVIAVIATGDELAFPGKPLAPGKIYNSNSASIASMVVHYGGIPRILGIGRDRERSISAKIEKGLKADAIITTGGISMGDYDVVRLLLGKMGRMLFHRIKMAPGSVVFSLLERPSSGRLVPVFGLAGPPSGSLINFETLVRPALLKMRGLNAAGHPEVEATATGALTGRRSMPTVRWTVLTGIPGAYRVDLEKGGPVPMAMANSLTIIPEGAVIREGDTVRVMPLDWATGGFYS